MKAYCRDLTSGKFLQAEVRRRSMVLALRCKQADTLALARSLASSCATTTSRGAWRHAFDISSTFKSTPRSMYVPLPPLPPHLRACLQSWLTKLPL